MPELPEEVEALLAEEHRAQRLREWAESRLGGPPGRRGSRDEFLSEVEALQSAFRRSADEDRWRARAYHLIAERYPPEAAAWAQELIEQEAAKAPILWTIEGACTGVAAQVVLAYYRGKEVGDIDIGDPNAGTSVETRLPSWDRYLYHQRERSLAFWEAVGVYAWSAAQAVYPNLYPLIGEEDSIVHELLAEPMGYGEDHPEYEEREGDFDEELKPWMQVAQERAMRFCEDHQFEIGAVTALLLSQVDEDQLPQVVPGAPLVAFLKRLDLGVPRDAQPDWGDSDEAQANLAEFLEQEIEAEDDPDE